MKVTDETFAAKIASAQKPVLVCFMSTFCGPSSALFPVLDDLLEETQDDFIYTEVDVEECPVMTRTFEVKAVPSLIWFAGGEPLGSRVGTMSEGFLRAFIKDMTAKSSS